MLIKKIKIRLLHIICVLFMPLLGAAQGGGPPPPGDDPPLPVPIDDNCSLLLVAGLFLALYTIRKSTRKAVNSKNKQEELVHKSLLITKKVRL